MINFIKGLFMKSNYSLTTRSLLFVSLTALTGLMVSPTVMASDHETQCFKDIQGKLTWNDNDMNWDPENIKQLCKGTTKPIEPRKCVASIRTSRVNWGKGTDWDWKNIINLCAGTNDAVKTEECFNKGISSGGDWRDVILLCQRSLNSQTHSNDLDWKK